MSAHVAGALFPSADAPNPRNHAYGAGEGREARLRAQAFQDARKFFIEDNFGGEAATLAALEAFGGEWVKRLPGPHHEDVLAAWDALFESGMHLDQHMLIKEWADKYAPLGNIAVPSMLVNEYPEGDEKALSPQYWVIVNHPEDHARLAAQNTRKSKIMTASVVGRNFLSLDDNDEWRRRRFSMIYAIAPHSVKNYFHKMERHAHILADKFRRGEESTFFYGSGEGPTAAFNIHEMVAHTAFAIAADSLYNLPDQTVNKWSRKVRWALQVQDRASPDVVAICKEWAAMLRAQPADQQGPLLQALHETHAQTPEKHGGPEEAFHDDVQVLSLAMHDTTAAAMTHCLMELARRPALQDRVAAEAKAVLGSRQSARPVVYDDLYVMPLLTKCINETLRLYPSVAYGTMRQLEQDDWLHTGSMGGDEKVQVPKGTTIMLQNYTNHRSKVLWGPDADEWKPERWLGYGDVDAVNFSSAYGPDGWTSAYSARNPQSLRFHPFARAPRQCFGMNFAQAEMRVLLPVLLSNFHFRLAEPSATRIATWGPDHLIFQCAGILKPRDGLWMHVLPREDSAPEASKL